MAGEVLSEIKVDSTLYHEETVFKACHQMSAFGSAEVVRDGPGTLIVKLRHDPVTVSAENLIRYFQTALVDYRIRRDLELRTAEIHRAIVAKAFGEGAFGPNNTPC